MQSPRPHLPLPGLRRLLVALLPTVLAAAPDALRTRNVFLITSDGLRWEELFSGADPELLTLEGGGFRNMGELARTRASFWRETAEARRAALLPFFWTVLAPQGQVFGNPARGSVARIANDKMFSYPGYNEMLTGWPDPTITSNDAIPNRNVTVLEWLHRKPAFSGRVAAFSAWGVMSAIVNRERCGFPVMAGWEPVPGVSLTPRQELLNDLIAETTRAGHPNEVFDSLLYHAAVEHLRANRPRVMLFSFLETDYWGHQGRYDRALEAAQRFDDYLRRLWELAQSLPEYRDQTTFIVTTDHGRGQGPDGWKRHGLGVKGAEFIWMAFLGPDTAALGERRDQPPVVQEQIAATLAAFLGEDYRAAEPRAAAAISAVIGRQPAARK